MYLDNYNAGYPPEAKELAIQLFDDGKKAIQVVAELQKKYPTFCRQTLSSWAINDPDGFGVVYRNSVATVAQRTLAGTFDQFEDIYQQTQAVVGKEDIDPAVFTGLRLMADISKNQQTGALLTLARIAKKNYGENVSVESKSEVKASLNVDMKAVEGLSIEQLLKAESTITDMDNKQHHEG